MVDSVYNYLAMKQLFRIMALVAIVVGVVACNKSDEQTGIGLHFNDETNLEGLYESEGGSRTYIFSTSHNWAVESFEEWIEVTPEAGGPYNTYFIVDVAPNPEIEQRESYVLVKLDNGNAIKVPIVQKKHNVINAADVEAYTMSAERSSLDVVVNTNVDFTISIPATAPWLKATRGTRALEDVTIIFDAEANDDDKSRYTTVTLLDEDGRPFYAMSIIQLSKGMARNEIHYTSTENRRLEFDAKENFGSPVLAHIYDEAGGRIIFGGEVVVINDEAFKGCSDIASVILPPSVTTIGNRVFDGCTSLARVDIPEGVTTLGDSVFKGCASLDSVVLPASVTSLGTAVFEGCDGEITFNGETPACDVATTDALHYMYGSSFAVVRLNAMVGASSFEGYASVERLYIGAAVDKLGSDAFAECSGLEYVYAEGLAQWCDIAFANGQANPLSNGCNLVVDSVAIRDLVVPADISTVGQYAFYGAVTLESITISDGVRSIGREAFYGCDDVELYIGQDITAVGNNAFAGCRGESLTIACNTPNQGGDSTSANHWLRDSAFGGVTFAEGVTSIGNLLFNGYESLVSVDMADSVEYVGKGAFAECDNLEEVSLGDGVRILDEHTFYMCPKLASITLPESIVEIYGYTFNGCTALRSITIPHGVTYLGEYLFGGCTALESIYCKPSTPPMLDNAYTFPTGVAYTIYVPEASLTDYRTAEFWKRVSDHIIGYAY